MTGDGYRIREQHEVHFLTFTVVRWIDVFTRLAYKEIIIDSLVYCQKNKGLQIHAWVIMSNHIHLLVSTNAPHKLSDFIRDFKKFTSLAIINRMKESSNESRIKWILWLLEPEGSNNSRNEKYQFWQQTNHPIMCDTNDLFETRMNYIHENPVSAGWVSQPDHFMFSSAIDYYTDQKGLLDIVKF